MKGILWLSKQEVDDSYINSKADLPYGLIVDEVITTIQKIHEFLYKINNFLVTEGYTRLEDILLLNTFAGLLSEVIVKSLSDTSKTLTNNTKIGGYPDLIPIGKYLDDSVQKGEGIEIKTSKQKSGWQGHNPEEGWVMIFRYGIDKETLPVKDRSPTEIIEVLAAYLMKKDWSFSGRKGTSRRTPTASILRSGTIKLRENWIYKSNHL